MNSTCTIETTYTGSTLENVYKALLTVFNGATTKYKSKQNEAEIRNEQGIMADVEQISGLLR